MEPIMIDLIKKTMLAGVGAAVVTKDKVEQVLGDVRPEDRCACKVAARANAAAREPGERPGLWKRLFG